MKKIYWSMLATILLFSCKKETDLLPKAPSTTNLNIAAAKFDTIPDKAWLKIVLGKDSINTDETAFIFNHLSNTNYNANDDARYLQGYGEVSLESISTNGIGLAINTLPYQAGMSVPLNIHTKTDGTYFLNMSYERNLPDYIHVWLKDNYRKDSLDLSTGKTYNFSVLKADTSSFGSKRFKIIIEDSNQQ
ncbi:MAG: hypothetical protein ABI203_08455 [Mucilaginibacter sp.]